MSPHDAFHQAVHRAPGGCEALAIRLGMSPAVLRNKANPNTSFNKPTLDDVLGVMGMTGEYGLLHAIAANFGFVCVKVGDEVEASDMAVLEMVAQVWATNGEVGIEVNSALADGRITDAEVVRIRATVKRAQRALEGVAARLSGMAETNPPRRP